MELIIISKNIDNNTDEYYNAYKQANRIWRLVFGFTYDKYECIADDVYVGMYYETPVVCAVVSKKNDKAFISCLASIIENVGNGKKLMRYIINDIRKDKNIRKIFLIVPYVLNDNNILIRDNKLYKFYKSLGFNDDRDIYYNVDYDTEEVMCLCINKK